MTKLYQLIREFQGWSIQPSLDHYGTYRIAEIAEKTENGQLPCEETDQRVVRLIQAAPDLFLACRETMDWIEQARHGTLTDMESAMGRKIPQSQMREALGKVLVGNKYAVCQNCQNPFLWPDLDLIDDLRQRSRRESPFPRASVPTAARCATISILQNQPLSPTAGKKPPSARPNATTANQKPRPFRRGIFHLTKEETTWRSRTFCRLSRGN